jgi:hypothetical protein
VKLYPNNWGGHAKWMISQLVDHLIARINK